MSSKKKDTKSVVLMKNMWCGGTAAVIVVNFIHPIDLIKTRLQISGEVGRNVKEYNGVSGVIRTVLADEGFSAFYKGIQPAWLREASYSTLRLGLYAPIRDTIGSKDSGFFVKLASGCLSGAIGSLGGNPFDVLKVRMMAYEGAENPGLSHFAKDIWRNQGISGFYKGISANIWRAAAMTGSKMAFYDSFKSIARNYGIKEGFQM